MMTMKDINTYRQLQLPYPLKSSYTHYYATHRGELIWDGNHQEYLEHQKELSKCAVEKVCDLKNYKVALDEYHASCQKSIQFFKNDLLSEFGIKDHPRSERLFQLLWEDYEDYATVLSKFGKYVDIIK